MTRVTDFSDAIRRRHEVSRGKELDAILGPKYKTVLAWSPPLPGAAAGRGRGGAQGAPPASRPLVRFT